MHLVLAPYCCFSYLEILPPRLLLPPSYFSFLPFYPRTHLPRVFRFVRRDFSTIFLFFYFYFRSFVRDRSISLFGKLCVCYCCILFWYVHMYDHQGCHDCCYNDFLFKRMYPSTHIGTYPPFKPQIVDLQ